MTATEHLLVDPFDPQDIRAKLPEMRRVLGAKRKELEALTDQVRSLGELVELMARLAPASPQPNAGKSGSVAPAKSAPGQERAVGALERAGRPMGPAALYAFLEAEGREDDMPKNANALGANLWAAARAGRIKKTTDGLYAPLTWEPPTEPIAPLVTDYRVAAKYGMPVPPGSHALGGDP
jgi:hypothetical protein